MIGKPSGPTGSRGRSVAVKARTQGLGCGEGRAGPPQVVASRTSRVREAACNFILFFNSGACPTASSAATPAARQS